MVMGALFFYHDVAILINKYPACLRLRQYLFAGPQGRP